MGQDLSSPSPTGGVTQTKDWRHIGVQMGFFGATLSAQPAAVGDASGGATVDAEARTAINDLLARLRTLGLVTT